MYKVGLSSCSKELCEELFHNYQKAGLKAMEISLPARGHLLVDYKEVAALAKKYDVKLWAYHLPYSPFNEVDISNKEISKKAVEYFSELIKIASDIGIDKFIVHPSGIIDDSVREEKKKTVKESLFALADIAWKSGGVIAVENMIPGCIGRNSSEMLELLEVSPKLRSCFDTNHLLGEDIHKYLQAVGDKIVTVHISDYDFVKERHWMPGEGKVDWNEMMRMLENIGYNSVWMYEVNFQCPNTIMRDRELRCEDIMENARKIFAGERPAAIGTPIE